METDWGYLMDLAQIITLILGVLAILAAVIKDIYASKGNKDVLQGEHKSIKEVLQGEHKSIKDVLQGEHESIKEVLRDEHNTILEKASGIESKAVKLQESVTSIDKHLAVEAVRRENMEKNLTKEQLDITRQIHAVTLLNEQMIKLQTECTQLRQRNLELSTENKFLREHLQALDQGHDQDQSPELSME
ncbi:hypothetical protein [Caproicibacter fermentans]|uniref:Uncharacterized protein n=1 Tax=Caproicibacter fermentans TaxID=2576756 RepID=A0A7G8T9Y4_9FIRM|nr:hypothetical protein [Caproicibacter fermentans]QNK40425.1 hypothetical protein HCR03_17520 [Caproicibacter fermentans]